MYYLIKYYDDYALIQSNKICHLIDIKYNTNHYLGLSKLIFPINKDFYNFWKIEKDDNILILADKSRRCFRDSNFTSKGQYRFIQIDDPIHLVIEITDSELIKMIDSVALGNDPDAIEYIMGVILNKYNIKQDE